MKSTRLLFIGVLVIVVLAGLYIIFSESDLLLGPGTSLDYDNSKSVIMALGQEGIKWYCGEILSYTDFAGNNYDEKDLRGLKDVLGNERRLKRDFCGKGTVASVCTGTILGDVNGDGKLDISDPISISDYINRGDKLNCLGLADFTKDGRVDIQDSNALTKFLFGTYDLNSIIRGSSSPSPSETATPSASASATPSATASASPSGTATPSATASVTIGSLKISSNPGRATLKIGGVTKGTTPSSSTSFLTLSLAEGSYSGQLIKSGYTTYSVSFSINAGQTTTLSLTLTPISLPSPTPSPSPTVSSSPS